MPDRAARLVNRIEAIDWVGRFDHTTSRAYLMKEYLRRVSWWARATKASRYPFFDIAALVDPAVRAAPAEVERVTGHLATSMQGVLVTRVCIYALHFEALL